MNNQEIIETLKKAKYWEDDFILKYDDKSFWELLKTLPGDKFEKIKGLLEKNITDTRYHAKVTEQLVKDIENGKYRL
jgi:hypothetical protein